MASPLDFEVKRFDDLSTRELHDLLKLRCDVFVVEQRCFYPELDGLDPRSHHLLGSSFGCLVAYARWYWRGARVILGRIVTHPQVRAKGWGRALVARALGEIGPLTVEIHAQARLADFYRGFGFVGEGEPFDEDGIPHLLMVRPASEPPGSAPPG